MGPITGYYYQMDARELFEKYVLCINPSQLWFLWMLFWVFVMAWPMWKLISKSIYHAFIIAALLWCVGIVGGKFLPNMYCICTAFQYMPFFCIGIQIRVRQGQMRQLIISRFPIPLWLLADIALFGLNRISELGYLDAIPKLTILIPNVLHAVGAVTAFVVLQEIAGKTNWKKNKTFATLSRYSMPMYLFHQQIIYFVIVWLNGRINPYINAGLNFIISCAGAMAISWVLMRFNSTRVLIGEGRKLSGQTVRPAKGI